MQRTFWGRLGAESVKPHQTMNQNRLIALLTEDLGPEPSAIIR
jgi:hypothetical protein